MSSIKIELGHPVIDGMPLSFRAPCNCNEVTGIKVEWPDGEDSHFIVFSFADAHGNDLTGLGNLFAQGAMVRVVLDTANAKAYIQNADTNAYLEERFNGKQNKLDWVTDEDLDAMFAGTYEGTEDEATVYDGSFTKGAL